jgi:hypothetical protein
MLPNFAMYFVAIFDKKVSGAFFPIWVCGSRYRPSSSGTR